MVSERIGWSSGAPIEDIAGGESPALCGEGASIPPLRIPKGSLRKP
jgi:hypothetical protein